MPRHTQTDGRAIVRVAMDRRRGAPLSEQIYASVAASIRDGRLRAGAPLPSTRALARDLSVARGTVIAALEQLRAAGYVDSGRGRVARISRQAPVAPARRSARPATPPRPLELSAEGRRIVSSQWDMSATMQQAPRAFRVGIPALDLFPVDVWGRLLARAWRRGSSRSLAYGDTRGYRPLREAIASYLRTARGMSCSEDQILICSGSHQAFSIAARLLLNTGDAVWVEDPGYPGGRASLAAHGARVVGVPVDREGLDVDAGVRLAPDARLALVTPARHVPLGFVMSPPRRRALVDWAARSGAWILEDDYDSELQYASRPPAPLHALDATGCVLLAGTFSKVLFPALRLGYLVVPPALAEAAAAAKRFADIASPYLEQAVLAEFISEGHFERHIRRMREVYQRRQDLLVALLEHRLGRGIDVVASGSGLNLVVWLPEGMDDERVARDGSAIGLELMPLSRFSVSPAPGARGGLVLGYGGIRERDLAEGVDRLATLMTQRVPPAERRRAQRAGVHGA